MTWYLGSQNDCLYIIDKPPSPSGNDEPWHDNPNGPTLALMVNPLGYAAALAVVDAHNASIVCGCTADADLAAGGVCPSCGHRDHGRSGCLA